MLKMMNPVAFVLWLLVLCLAAPAPLLRADDEDDKAKEEEQDDDTKKDDKSDEDEDVADEDEDEGGEGEDVEIDEDDGKGGTKKIQITRRQTSYRSPSPDKEMFNADKLSLNQDEKNFIVTSMLELAGDFSGHKQVTHRMRGHALGIAMRLDPENQVARQIDLYLSNGVSLPKKFKSPNKVASDMLDSAKILIDGGKKDDNLCAAYLLDLASRINPEDEDISKVLTEHTESGFKADWEGTLVGSSSGIAGGGGDLGEARASLISKAGTKGSFKRRQTTVKGLVVIQLPSGEHAGQANQLNATALPDPTATGVNIRINQDVGPMMRGSLEEVAKIMQLKHENTIPSGYKIEIGFADKYTPKDGPSAAVAFTLLLDSLLGDFEIDEKFACTGDISADGYVQKIGGVDAKIRGAARKGCELVAVPAGNSDGLRDVAILEGIGPVLEAQVFAVKKYDEAVEVARTDRSENMQKAIDEFKLIQAVVEKKGESILRNAYVVKKLENILELAPNHLTATVLLEYSQNNLPKQLSLRGSYSAVGISCSTIISNIRGGSHGGVAEKDIEKAFEEMDKIKKKIDKRIMPYFDALYEYCEIARDIEDIDDPQNLSKKDKETLKEAAKVIEAAETKLRNNRELQEEMMD